MKLLFDANVSQHAVKLLIDLLSVCREEGELRHLVEDFPLSTPDSGFIRTYAEQGYLIVTGNSGKQSGQKDQLLKICMAEGATHVLFTGRLQQRRTFDKMRAVITAWPEIVEAANAPAGSRCKLQQRGKSFSLQSFSLKAAF